jgi:cation:H+ antiporter
MAVDLSLLGLGLVFAGTGGELFVRGLVGLAVWLRFPAGVIGATVAAFATSSPELTVAITAAADGRPEIALGDALGSNIVNIGLVVGVVLLLGTTASADISRRDALTGLAMALLLLVLVVDGELSRIDGVVLLLTFAGWMSVTLERALSARSAAVVTVAETRHARAVVTALIGLVFLVVAGRLLVTGAKSIGEDLGISTFVVGVVLVSLGTSLPELATAVISRLRGHAEIGLGAALGSNIFNTSFVVGLAAVIAPIGVDRRDVSISLLFGAALILVLLVGTGGKPLRRWRGVALVGAYTASIVTLLALQG